MDSPADILRRIFAAAEGVLRVERLAPGFAAAALVFITLSGGCNGTRSGGSDAPPGSERIVIEGHAFDLELALDQAARARGLMGVEEIPEDGGMLFVFPEPAHQGFWMANCLTDIDIIYLDAFGRVTATHRMAAEPPRQPDESTFAYHNRLPRYPSRRPAQFVIELKAGWLDQLDLKVEDKIELDLDRLKAMAE